MVSVISLMGAGFGTRTTPCMSQKIAHFWMKDLGVLRMEDQIRCTLSGDGNPKIATYPGL